MTFPFNLKFIGNFASDMGLSCRSESQCLGEFQGPSLYMETTVMGLRDTFWLRSLWLKSCENSLCSDIDSNHPIMTQFRTCHDSWAVVACAKLWHGQSIVAHVQITLVLQNMDHEFINSLWNGSRGLAELPVNSCNPSLHTCLAVIWILLVES